MIASKKEKLDNTILLSICCISYNHQDFIADAIEGFLAQKTNFTFEILIDDDCSTDNTQAIISKYQKKYPHLIKANLRDKNIGVIDNVLANMGRAEGKYIALCEGDDYWVDEYKLQRQFDALENNPDCSFCGHDVNIVNEEKKLIRKHSQSRINQNWKEGVFSSLLPLASVWSVPHTSAMFYRKKYFNADYIKSLKNNYGTDYSMFVYLCDKGDFYYIDKPMSSYRKHTNGVSASWVYAYNNKLMNDTVIAHESINAYFNDKYKKEIIDIHLNGLFMEKYAKQLEISMAQKKYIEFMKNILRMCKHSTLSQYSYRDILWLVKYHILKAVRKKI